MTSPALEARIPVSVAAQDLLDTIVATFGSYDVELPERRLVTVGSVAVEDEVLAVMFGGMSVGLPGNDMSSPVSYDQPRTLTFNVELWRNTPGSSSPRAPKASAISESSKKAMDDSWILMEAAYAADQRNHGRGILADISVSPPQGAMHGVGMRVEMQSP